MHQKKELGLDRYLEELTYQPEQVTLTNRLNNLKKVLTNNQIRMLMKHAAAENYTMPLNELRDIGGFQSTSDALFAYADIARKYNQLLNVPDIGDMTGLSFLPIILEHSDGSYYEELCLNARIAMALEEMQW